MKRTDIKADGTRYWVADSNTWAEYGEGGPEVLLTTERWQRNRGWSSRTTTVADSTGTDQAVHGEPHAAGSHLLMERTYQAGEETIRVLSLVTPAQVRGTEKDCRHQAAEARARRDAGEQARRASEADTQSRIDAISEEIAATISRKPATIIRSRDGHYATVAIADLEALLGLGATQDGGRS